LLVVVLLLQLPGDGQGQRTTRERRAAEPAVVTLPAATLRAHGIEIDPRSAPRELEGWVLDNATGEPLPGARVALCELADVTDGARDDSPFAAARTDETGGFRLPLDHAAVLRVVAADHLPEVREVEPAGDGLVRLVPATTRTFVVIDLWDRPVEGALARLRAPGRVRPLGVARSDANGEFVMPVARGTTLQVGAPGYLLAEVTSPQGRWRRPVVLRPDAELAGVVEDEAGCPLSGVRVVCERPFRPGSAATTDAAGRFRLDGVDPGHDATVSIEQPGYARLDAIAAPGSVDLRLVLRRAPPAARMADLAGVVEGPDGRPVAGADVASNAVGPGTRTARDGSFTLAVAAGARYTVWAAAGATPALPGEPLPPPALRGKATIEVPGPPVRVTLERVPRSFLALRFVDVSGRPVPGIGIWPGLAMHASDEEGRMLVAAELPPGSRARLVASQRCFRTPFEASTYEQSECPEQEIVLGGHPRAELVVRLPDGTPLPPGLRAKIQLYPWQAIPLGGTERSDRVSFEFDPEAAAWCRGKLFVTISAPGYLESRPRPPLPENGGIVEVRLESGARVTGRLVTSEGTPARTTAWIRALPQDGEGDGIRASAEAGDGRFELPRIAPGRWRLIAGYHAGVPLWQLPIDARDGSDIDVGTVSLPPARAMSGTVTDDHGVPLSGVRIEIVGDVEFRTATNAAGSFTLPLPDWARVVVRASKAGYGTRGFPLAAAQRVVLPEAGSVDLAIVRGERLDPNQTGFALYASPPGARWSWQPEAPQERLEDGWLYHCTDLPPGPLEFRAETPEGKFRVTVDVIPGRTVEATLRFP